LRVGVHDAHALVARELRQGLDERGQLLPWSRPQAVESSATSTSSRTPASISSRASSSTASSGFERCGPRIDGMAQKLHVWSQPWEMRRYA
jgi:hypothetical protein